MNSTGILRAEPPRPPVKGRQHHTEHGRALGTTSSPERPSPVR